VQCNRTLTETVSRIDVGASQLIIDGKIKLKNDSHIERFTKSGIKFQNGSELPADVCLFATGYGSMPIVPGIILLMYYNSAMETQEGQSAK
jgi:hypothetical protein